MGSCGSGNPQHFYVPAAVRCSQDLAGSTRYELAERKLCRLVCQELQGTAPLAVPCHTGEAPLTHPAAPLRADGSKKDEAGLVQFRLSHLQGTLIVGEWSLQSLPPCKVPSKYIHKVKQKLWRRMQDGVTLHICAKHVEERGL